MFNVLIFIVRKGELYRVFVYFRAKIWAVACHREDLIKKRENLHHSSYRICGMHFENNLFSNRLHNRLKKNAIPTIFPAQESSSIISLDNSAILSNKGRC